MDSPSATIHIDGAARGNPGPAAYAVVMALADGSAVEEADTIGTATNNVAEYTALVRALERASEMGLKQLAVFSDSELMVKQMNGEYRVKHPDLLPLYEAAKNLKRGFEAVTITHVRREHNKRADAIGNEALDGKPRRRGGPNLTPQPPSLKGKGEPEGGTSLSACPDSRPLAPPSLLGKGVGGLGSDDSPVRADAVACLAAAAAAWADKGRTAVSPEAVWEQLWSILEDGGVLKKKKK